MASLQKLTAAAVVVFASTFALADSIQLGSYASGASMGDANTAMNFAGFNAASATPSIGTGATYTLSPGGAWGAALANSTWVGAAPSAGPLGTVNPALGYYTFTTSFTALSGGVYSGILSLMADDTAEVLLNGSVLVPMGTIGGDSHCADGGPSCRTPDTVALHGLSLLGGTNANTLTFVVQQAGDFGAAGSDPSGLDFAATLSSGAVPEPGTLGLMLIGMGSIGGGLLMRRMAAKSAEAKCA